MPRHPLTVAVGVAVAGAAAIVTLGELTATAGSGGPLSCPGDRVTIHHVDHEPDLVAGGPADPVAALTRYLSRRGLDRSSNFVPIAVGADVGYFGTTRDGHTVAVATVNRFGASWRLSEFVACSDLLAEGVLS